MFTRRQWLARTVGASAALALNPDWLEALQQGQLLTRAIPSTGEQLPLVGLGSSATFSQVARSEDFSALREVLRTLVERGGKVFDTAPSYGASEEVAGTIAAELGLTEQIFWATTVKPTPPGWPASGAPTGSRSSARAAGIWSIRGSDAPNWA